MTRKLSIAVVLHNSETALEDCLRSVRPAVASGWADVIAVDNASPDRSVDVLARELPEARLIVRARNHGFAAGVNAALGAADGDYWVLLNPDVRVPPQGLEELARWMDAHPWVGVASPDIVDAQGRWESPGRAKPSVSRTLLECSRLHRLLPKHTRGRVLRGPYWPGGDQVDAGWVPGTVMIIRPAAARAAGSWREDLFMYGEDIEWCSRVRRAGWAIGVCSTTTFIHRTSSSALLTFGADETSKRIAAGIDAACRAMYRQAHARALAAATAASLWLEAWAPGRDPSHRASARNEARTWQKLARQ